MERLLSVEDDADDDAIDVEMEDEDEHVDEKGTEDTVGGDSESADERLNSLQDTARRVKHVEIAQCNDQTSVQTHTLKTC